MGIGSFLRRSARVVGRVASSPMGQAGLLAASIIPGMGLVTRAGGLATRALSTAGRLARTPAGRASLIAAGAGAAGFGAGRFGGPDSGGLPALPDMGGGAPMPAMGGRGHRITKAQLASLPIVLEGGLMQYTRAPTGYVSVMTAEGPVAMRRDVAIAQGYFRPAKKPPISVRDHSAMKRINHVFKVMSSFNRDMSRIARHASKGMGGRRGGGAISAGNSVYIEKGPGNLVLKKGR